MTHCSDNENVEQSDDGGEKQKNKQKKRRTERKHVSFPPDEQIVSGFAEHRGSDHKGKFLFTTTEQMTHKCFSSCSFPFNFFRPLINLVIRNRSKTKSVNSS